MRKQHLEQLKNASAGHNLIKAARLYNELMIKNLRATLGMDDIQAYHLNLFAHISLEGSTIVEIAEKVGISKQAVSKTISELVEMKVLQQKSHPTDKRSKIICFPEDGPFTLEKGLKFLGEQDKMLKKILGSSSFNLFSDSVAKVILELDKP